jgi:hypothetical protein
MSVHSRTSMEKHFLYLRLCSSTTLVVRHNKGDRMIHLYMGTGTTGEVRFDRLIDLPPCLTHHSSSVPTDCTPRHLTDSLEHDPAEPTYSSLKLLG